MKKILSLVLAVVMVLATASFTRGSKARGRIYSLLSSSSDTREAMASAAAISDSKYAMHVSIDFRYRLFRRIPRRSLRTRLLFGLSITYFD